MDRIARLAVAGCRSLLRERGVAAAEHLGAPLELLHARASSLLAPPTFGDGSREGVHKPRPASAAASPYGPTRARRPTRGHLLSLDHIKEALADVLGLGDELWSDRMGDAAAEVVFRLVNSFPGAVAEGWWRRERRARAVQEFEGCTEVFCRCDPALAQQRATARHREARHPIHRDVINPTLIDGLAAAAGEAQPLRLGGALIEVDTTHRYDFDDLVANVSMAVRNA